MQVKSQQKETTAPLDVHLVSIWGASRGVTRFEEQPAPKQPGKCFLSHKTMRLTKSLTAIIGPKGLMYLVC